MGDEAKERYTLHEAAEFAARGNTKDTSRILHKLKQSVLSDMLKVYQPGSSVSYEVEGGIRIAAENLSKGAETDASRYPGGIALVDFEFDERLRELLLPNDLEAYWDELNAWLEGNEPRLYEKWKFPKPKVVKVVVHGLDGQPGNDWKDKAREIADELFDHDTLNHCRDSLVGYSERVMKMMQERQIHGPRGRIDNPKTIQREALQASQWWGKKKK